jgi:hypothetical protein
MITPKCEHCGQSTEFAHKEQAIDAGWRRVKVNAREAWFCPTAPAIALGAFLERAADEARGSVRVGLEHRSGRYEGGTVEGRILE